VSYQSIRPEKALILSQSWQKNAQLKLLCAENPSASSCCLWPERVGRLQKPAQPPRQLLRLRIRTEGLCLQTASAAWVRGVTSTCSVALVPDAAKT